MSIQLQFCLVTNFSFWPLLLSLLNTHRHFPHALWWLDSPFVVSVAKYPVSRRTTGYLPNAAAEGHLDCFQVIAIKNKDAMNIYVKAFCRLIYICILFTRVSHTKVRIFNTAFHILGLKELRHNVLDTSQLKTKWPSIDCLHSPLYLLLGGFFLLLGNCHLNIMKKIY